MRGEKIKINIKPLAFYVVFFLFILAFSTNAPSYDFDLWAKLLVGKSFVQLGYVLKHDVLSYIPTHPWFDHEWGSGVVFYLIQKNFPNAGLILLQTFLVFSTFFVVTKTVELRGVKTTTAYNFIFYYLAFSTFSYITDAPIRCQLFSFLFFALFLYILEYSRKNNSKGKELFFLPLIMILWQNLHGGCIIGFCLIAIYIIGEFLDKKPVKKYMFAFLFCLSVLFINPWGYNYIRLLALDSLTPRPLISEWMGLFYKSISFMYIKFKLFALVLIMSELMVTIKQLRAKEFVFDKVKFLVLVFTLIISIKHIKMLPFATIAMSCFIYDNFYTVLNSATKDVFNKIAIVKDVLIYTIILIFSFATIKARGFGPYLDWFRYPSKAVEFIRINDLKGKLLEDFTFGSFVSYKLYPHNTIYMDGRYVGVYDDSVLYLLGYFHVGKTGWDYILKAFPPDIILLEKMQPVCYILKKTKEWKAVYEDNHFILFIRTKYAKKSYKQPSNDLEYYKKNLFETDVDFREINIRK